jgi:hypothetical protein
MDLRWAITLFLKVTMLWRRFLPLAYPNRPVCLQGDPAFTAVVFQDENPRLGDHTPGTIERWFKHQILSSFVETLRNATIYRPPTGPILRQSPHNPCLFLQERLSDLTSNAYVNTPGLIIVHILSHKHLP